MNNDNLKTLDERLETNAEGDPWFDEATPKTQLSPRFALAFPITDKGYLHFSYGHFFQNPNFSYIYNNPEFEVPAASGVNSTMGNANMEPQRTTQYEVGFSQQIGRDIGVELTGYYKDIRNLNSTEIKNSFIAGDRYGVYVTKTMRIQKELLWRYQSAQGKAFLEILTIPILSQKEMHPIPPPHFMMNNPILNLKKCWFPLIGINVIPSMGQRHIIQT